MKKILTGLVLAVGILSLGSVRNVRAQEIPTMEFYYGYSCPHCHEEMKWFPELLEMYPDLEIQKFEVWKDPLNRQKWYTRMKNLGMEPRGVPTNIIEDEVVIGFSPDKIVALMEKHYGEPSVEKDIPIDQEGWKKYLDSSWPVMSVVLGLLDGFNPCAMWTLLILIGFLLSMDDKRKRWLIGGIFLASSGIIYFGALLTYLLGFTQISQFVAGPVMTWIFRIVGIIAVGTGIASLWSARKKDIDCEVRDAGSKKKFRDKLADILAREKTIFVLTGVIGLAFSVNAIELLCSFAIPTTFTATLVSLGLPMWQKITAITLYDLMYMLDDIIVLVVALYTLNLKILSPRLIQISHFIGGLLLLILGGFLLYDPGILASWIG
ncbi:hypothetical protein K9M59_03485 [Candidatus Gracilibacteria bacterium]|nr:hypothetical protein [Candidatus Gracilibacteria bacterium]MCF7819389.1 hypothetical protein [Candidatus Gracilibacteria bacterium]